LESNLKNKAVFIDRDGTINRDVPYCSRPEDFELLPGVGEGIRLLKEAGYKIIVITNQSGIARGYFTREMLDNIHTRMNAELAKYHASIDAIYYCPHHPDDNCDCRKPKPKMIFEAARDQKLDLAQSFVIGDSEKDVEMGIKAKCKESLLINSEVSVSNIKGFDSFLDAVNWIVNNDKDIELS
jgi:D,D-heptose 1,7-bisphosphate phosphatase